ncbi:12365_t:CDS:2 [Dentiscutata heterogama]|uniref:12365_t:CDS:1 n=1 Tax=Dentiscutata heterogama TaxID=1316150 RepID=A0ACA9K3P1_9GLOM|nr:12365_t:CDS:2 [Dentiscutata heterogama]
MSLNESNSDASTPLESTSSESEAIIIFHEKKKPFERVLEQKIVLNLPFDYLSEAE